MALEDPLCTLIIPVCRKSSTCCLLANTVKFLNETKGLAITTAQEPPVQPVEAVTTVTDSTDLTPVSPACNVATIFLPATFKLEITLSVAATVGS